MGWFVLYPGLCSSLEVIILAEYFKIFCLDSEISPKLWNSFKILWTVACIFSLVYLFWSEFLLVQFLTFVFCLACLKHFPQIVGTVNPPTNVCRVSLIISWLSWSGISLVYWVYPGHLFLFGISSTVLSYGHYFIDANF